MDFCSFGQGKESFVILPGLSVQRVLPSADAIAKAYEPLTNEFTVYVFERRNDMPDPYPVSEMARDTAEAIGALELGEITLFGASQGGMIGMQIAIDRPELVKCLILGSTTARVTEDQYRLFEKSVSSAKAEKPAELMEGFAGAIYPPKVFAQLKGMLPELAKAVTDEDLKRFVTQAEALRGFDISDELKRISCPVLVIGSKSDSLLGAEPSEQIRERIKNCELFLYNDYGHAAYDLAPDYKIRMMEFVKSRS